MKMSSIVTAAAILGSCAAPAQPAIRLKARAATARAIVRRPAAFRGTHFILQFQSYPDAQIRAEIARRGMRILEYVPDNALMVAALAPSLEGLDLVWAGPLDISDKISPQLDLQTAGALLVEFHTD